MQKSKPGTMLSSEKIIVRLRLRQGRLNQENLMCFMFHFSPLPPPPPPPSPTLFPKNNNE